MSEPPGCCQKNEEGILRGRKGKGKVEGEGRGKPRNTKSSRTFRCNNCCMRNDRYKKCIRDCKKAGGF